MEKRNHAPKPNYYQELMLVNNAIDNRIKKQVIEDGQSLNIDFFVLEFTRMHPVSEKKVRSRISLFVEVNKDKVMILDGEVMPV